MASIPENKPFVLQEVDPNAPEHQQLQVIETRPTLSAEADVVVKRGEPQVVITIVGFDDAAQAAEFAEKINEMDWNFTPPEAEGANFAPPDTIRVIPGDADEEDDE